jgi:hypothetical protein
MHNNKQNYKLNNVNKLLHNIRNNKLNIINQLLFNNVQLLLQ